MNVIPVDDEDDVEILYSDVLPSTYNLLSQEMELLQAFAASPKPIPMEYSKFYKCAKEVNNTYSDTVIVSAWKRSISKELTHILKQNIGLSSSPKGKTAHTKNTPVIDLTEANEPTVASSPIVVPPTLLARPVTEEVVPVALFANPIVHRPSLIVKSDSDDEDIIVTSRSKRNSKVQSNCDNRNTRYHQTLIEVPCDSSPLSEREKTEVDPLTTKPDILNKYMPTTYPIANSDNSLTGYDFNFKNRSSRGNESGTTFAPKCRKRKYKETKNTSTLSDLSENENSTLTDSYVEDQAKIRKVKTKKSNKKKCDKYMSETELKLFREEQKQQKLREKRELASKQLEIVHDRLVDILIPKYFKKVNSDKH